MYGDEGSHDQALQVGKILCVCVCCELFRVRNTQSDTFPTHWITQYTDIEFQERARAHAHAR